MTIRRATSEDSPALLELAQSAPGAAHWTNAAWANMLAQDNSRSIVFLAEHDHRILGFIAASFVLDVAEIENIAVAAMQQRSGVGTALIHALRTWATERNLQKLQLEVSAANTPARAFYRALGFVEQGLRPHYYPSGEDAILMELAI